MLSFVKFQVKLSNFDGVSKISAIILDFWTSQGSVATQLRWGGRPCNSYIVSLRICQWKKFENCSIFAKIMIKTQLCWIFVSQCTSMCKLWLFLGWSQLMCGPNYAAFSCLLVDKQVHSLVMWHLYRQAANTSDVFEINHILEWDVSL